MSNPETLKRVVRETYAEIARGERVGCGPASAKASGESCCASVGETAGESCCGPSPSVAMGYAEQDLATLPEGADLGLGCGNPGAIAELQEGETVLDLGSGAGIDCFLAGERVGATGRVIGVDMTPDMLERARANAEKVGARNVEFRLGEIESLPVADGSVDVVISNCVVNLSPDKARVYREAFRALRPGGRVAISDMVAVQEIPTEVRQDPRQYAGCVSGAVAVAETEAMLRQAGFRDVTVEVAARGADQPGHDFVRSASVRAVRPTA